MHPVLKKTEVSSSAEQKTPFGSSLFEDINELLTNEMRVVLRAIGADEAKRDAINKSFKIVDGASDIDSIESLFANDNELRFVIVRARDDIESIERLISFVNLSDSVDNLNKHYSPIAGQNSPRAGGRADLMVGVCALGETWPSHSVDPSEPDQICFRPQQTHEAGIKDSRMKKLSSEVGSDLFETVGAVAFAGQGVARIDQSVCFNAKVAPGEGCLLLSQVLREVLSKLNIIPKFGA